MFTACTENVVNSYEEAKGTAKITISVLDGNSNEPIAGASVKTQFDSKGKLTDSSGYAILKDKDIGTYIFEISKEDYATIRTSVVVEETGANDVSRVPDVVKTVPLYKAGVSVSGNVYYTDPDNGNLVPAESVTVILSYTDASVFPSEVTAVTDEDGYYEFENLAEKVTYSIEALQTTIDKKLFKCNSAVTASNIRSGSSKVMSRLVMSMEGETPALLSSNLQDVETETVLELNFSVALDADSLAGKWNVKKGTSAVLTTTKLSNDGKTLKIYPVSEYWSDNASYTISGRAVSKDGIGTDISRSFKVGTVEIPGQVSSLTVATDSTDYDEDMSDTYNFNNNIYLKLSWKAPKVDVDGYKIYYMTNDMSDFVYYETVSTTSYKSALGYLDVDITSAKKVSFIVLPYNAAGTANAIDAESVAWTVVK